MFKGTLMQILKGTLLIRYFYTMNRFILNADSTFAVFCNKFVLKNNCINKFVLTTCQI